MNCRRDDRADPETIVGDGLLTIKQVAEWLQLSRSRIYELLADGSLPSVTIGRARRIPRRALIELASRDLRGVGGDKR